MVLVLLQLDVVMTIFREFSRLHDALLVNA